MLIITSIFFLPACRNKNNDININNYYKELYNLEESIYDELTIEKLIYLLDSDGKYLIYFSFNNDDTNLKTINDYLKERGITKIYYLNFNIDMEDDYSSIIYEDNYNYIYYEIVSRYLKELDNIISNEEEIIDNNLLFLYESKLIDAMIIKNKNDVNLFYNSNDFTKLSTYSDSIFIKNAYNKNKIIFNDEKINIKILTYNQLKWLLSQNKKAIILFSGSWCENSKAIIKEINKFAVSNNMIIYTFDIKLDGGYYKKYWGYDNDLSITKNNDYKQFYINIIEKYLPFIKTSNKAVVSNNNISVPKIQIPYLFLYDKTKENSIIKYVEQMYSLDENKLNYVYKNDNYNNLLSTLNDFFKI